MSIEQANQRSNTFYYWILPRQYSFFYELRISILFHGSYSFYCIFLLYTFYRIYIFTFALFIHYLSKIVDWQSKARKFKLFNERTFFLYIFVNIILQLNNTRNCRMIYITILRRQTLRKFKTLIRIITAYFCSQISRNLFCFQKEYECETQKKQKPRSYQKSNRPNSILWMNRLVTVAIANNSSPR